MIKAFIKACVCMALIFAAACGKDQGSGGGTFIPDISAKTWINKADTTGSNTFFFLVNTTNANSSTFTGNENPLGGGSQYHFSGSFTNHNISFTYDSTSGPKSKKSYSGTVNDASTVITLSSAALGSLVLESR